MYLYVGVQFYSVCLVHIVCAPVDRIAQKKSQDLDEANPGLRLRNIYLLEEGRCSARQIRVLEFQQQVDRFFYLFEAQ
jgi:hypothetical protein